MAIGVFGSVDDPHIGAVCDHLKRGNHRFQIFDIYSSGRISLAWEGATRPGSHASPGFSAIWRRTKPHLLRDYDGLADYYDRMFAMGEWRRVLAYLDGTSPDIFYMNPAGSDLRASDKLHQMDVAKAVGLVFPDTICTNNPRAVLEFAAAQAGGRCIHKSLGPYMAPGGRVKFATLLGADRVNSLAGEIAACPSLYQQFIASDCEFRVTAVGEELFAVRILKPDSTIVDWRRSSIGNRFEVMTLDCDLEAAILRMQSDLGLVYGAYDFIRGSDGTDYFLEVNPMGQWLWLEAATELPISRAIANLLAVHGKG